MTEPVTGASPSPTLSSTTTLDEAASRTWDALVVGAGVAGTLAAGQLAARGHAVLLVEKKAFPRYKVCGCCLNERSVAALERVGALHTLAVRGARPLHGIQLHARRYNARLPLPGGLAVSRDVLDTTLAEMAHASGAELLFGVRADPEPSPTGHTRSARITKGSRHDVLRARLIVAADGLSGQWLTHGAQATSTIRRNPYVGVGSLLEDDGDRVEPGVIQMYCAKAGYAGLVRTENGALAVAAAVDPARLRAAGSPADMVRQILEESGDGPPSALDASRWYGTPPLTRQTSQVAGERLVALGDATGYVEPFTGEGMAWAMESASLLDDHLSGFAPEDWDAAAAAWHEVWKKQIPRRQCWCRGLSAVLRYPRVTAGCVRLLSRAPALSRPIVSALNRRVGS